MTGLREVRRPMAAAATCAVLAAVALGPASGTAAAHRNGPVEVVHLRTPVGMSGEVQGVTESGTVWGRMSSTLTPWFSRGFIWSGGGTTVTDIGTLGGRYTDIGAVGRDGAVVGGSETSSGAYHAFIWRGGVMTDINPFPGWSTSAARIGRQGDILLAAWTAGVDSRLYDRTRTGKLHALPFWPTAVSRGGAAMAPIPDGGGWMSGVYVYARGKLTTIPAPPAGPEFGWGGLNDAGMVWAGELSGIGIHGETVSQLALLYTPENGWRSVGAPEASNHSIVAVNDRGAYLLDEQADSGKRAWLVEGGALNYLRPLPGDDISQGRALSARGDVAGLSWRNTDGTSATSASAVLWPRHGHYPLRLGPATKVIDVNSRGVVVGASIANGVEIPTIWRK